MVGAPTLPPALLQPTALSNRIRLIIPTSLCAGQIARLIADKLNGASASGGPRYVALPHTEGCGVSGEAIDILEQVIAGYAVHPLAERVLLLEHGCEKTHNDAIRNFLAAHGIDHSAMGFASIQLDGGIDRVTDKVMKWFETPSGSSAAHAPRLSLGLTSVGEVPAETATALAQIASAIVVAGGSVIVPETASLLRAEAFVKPLFGSAVRASLAYGAIPAGAGLHVMTLPGDQLIEALTGLGASGANLLLTHVGTQPAQAHPFVPTLQISSAADHPGADVLFGGVAANERAGLLASALVQVWSGAFRPKAQSAGNVDFQVSRGWFGVST
jgi:altronate dehydratase